MAKTKSHCMSSLLMGLSCALATQAAPASEMVYYPLNPSFGGSPLNGPVLLNSALATNKHNAPDIESDRYDSAHQPKSQLDNFKESLERSVLNRLASAATSKMLDSSGNFVPGNFETENFQITITDNGAGTMIVTTIDKLTGGITTFEVSQ